MSSPEPVDVHVDFAELGRVHTELQNLLAQVEGLDQVCAIHPDSESMGSAIAADAIAWFETHWRTERESIVTDMAACVTYVELALQGYGRTEHTLESVAAYGLTQTVGGEART